MSSSTLPLWSKCWRLLESILEDLLPSTCQPWCISQQGLDRAGDILCSFIPFNSLPSSACAWKSMSKSGYLQLTSWNLSKQLHARSHNTKFRLDFLPSRSIHLELNILQIKSCSVTCYLLYILEYLTRIFIDVPSSLKSPKSRKPCKCVLQELSCLCWLT